MESVTAFDEWNKSGIGCEAGSLEVPIKKERSVAARPGLSHDKVVIRMLFRRIPEIRD